MYSKLELIPGQTSAPLLVNHDYDREIGTVHRIFREDWTDGFWYFAVATIPEEPPCWLKRNCPVSFGVISLHRNDAFTIGGVTADVLYRGYVKEISVLVGRKPREPLAEVFSVRRSKDSPAVATSDVAGEIIYGTGELIRRPGIGRVLAVR